MFQVPAHIWQAIAKVHPEMNSRWGKAMAGGQLAIDRLLAEVDREHKAAGVPDRVTLAYEITAPLLIEGDAIQAWIRDTEAFEMRQVLLDYGTPRDAALVGGMEYRLTPEEQALLTSLLSRELEASEEDSPPPNTEPDIAPPSMSSAMRKSQPSIGPLAAPASTLPPSQFTYALVVDGVHFRQGVKLFGGRYKVRASDTALFAFDGTFLTVEALDRVFAAAATGTWPGVAKVSATFVIAMAKAPPADVELRLSYADGRLRLGTLSIDCDWQPVSDTLLELPASPDWIEALSLKYRATRARIVAAGLKQSIGDAEQKLAALVRKTAKPLAPLGVSERDLNELIERRLVSRWCETPESER